MDSGLHLDHAERQGVLDAVAALQVVRGRALATLGVGAREAAGAAGGASGGAEIVASGDVTRWLMARSGSWTHLLSTRSAVSADSLSRSLPNNRRCEERGLRMVSVFDLESTEPAARRLLENEHSSAYLYAYAPVQLKIIDHRQVLLQGPTGGDRPSLLSLTSPRALHAATSYWEAVIRTAIPCRPPDDDRVFSSRQMGVLALLGEDLTDDRIATVLGVSVRTVRAEVSTIMSVLGVHSRFAAGYAFAALGRDRRPA